MEKKLRRSRQRELILQYLTTTKDHPSADMVYEALRGEIENISLGTVYRNLKVLEELGLVRRITTLQSVERYDGICYDHPHFVCNQCDKVIDLDGKSMEDVKNLVQADAKHQVEWVDLSFGGICDLCQKKQAT